MKKIISLLIILAVSAFINSSAFSGHHKATFQYGGDWVNTTVVANGDYFIMVGAFVGTNEMVREAGEVIITNFTCPGIFINGVGNGACKMKLAGSEDFYILDWACDAESNCKGKVVNGTGRFEGASGELTWVHNGGFGKGSGTFLTK
ncbi:MAG: hypothetical protein CFH32_01381 [Alphaproteobacteria bacterium MarineAlpha9_Bin2]|nr:MAG: hypothetical protein CFH32_01381 [Alphaproteobacteria bacterium MarineAlpha9_Bin2]PPR30004.1 MAG: hypothetical protein CFH31_00070 [Alphaproteobacteria bacterium MarineAlpha9_Bin1]